jgi:hypothetical protein
MNPSLGSYSLDVVMRAGGRGFGVSPLAGGDGKENCNTALRT